MYYKIYTSEKKIPSIFVFILLTVILISLSIIFKTTTREKKLEKSLEAIDSIQITNVTSYSAGIVVCVKRPMIVELYYGKKESKSYQKILDDRDVATSRKARRCNYFSLKSLDDGIYKLIPKSQGQTLTNVNYEFKTDRSFKFINIAPLYGKVVDIKTNPVSSGIVIVTFDGMNLISGLIKSGDWLVSLHYLKLLPRQNAALTITMIDDYGQKSVIKTTYNLADQLKNTLVLGREYDFIPFAEGQQVGQTQAFEQLDSIDILYPKNNAAIAASRPLIKGVALPNKAVKLKIENILALDKKIEKPNLVGFTTNKSGLWNYYPKFDFLPGEYKITLNTRDEKNREKSVAHIFTILKSGENILGEATPEATIKPQITLTPTPTSVTPTPTEALVPTATLQPSLLPTIIEPTLSQTNIPTPSFALPKITSISAPTLPITASPIPSLPNSGFTTLPLHIISLGLITAGTLLFFLF